MTCIGLLQRCLLDSIKHNDQGCLLVKIFFRNGYMGGGVQLADGGRGDTTLILNIH